MLSDKLSSEKLIIEAYRIIGSLTPISADCGALCGRRCCQGTIKDGMLLFPGEEKLYSGRKGFKIFRTSIGDYPVRYIVCRGSCPRYQRPLACRTFPFAPFVAGNEIRVIPDPRARAICPLLGQEAKDYISPLFIEKLLECFTLLNKNDEIHTFLVALSGTLSDYMPF